MAFLYVNFLSGTLASPIDSDDLQIDCGASFADKLPTITAPDVVAVTLSDGQQPPEICYISANVSGLLTISRGEELTTPQVWSAGTRVRGTLTAEMLEAVLSPVTSVNGRSGAVVLDKTDVGLGNVDNTSDLAKPVSTATQTAIDGLETTITQNVLDTIQPALDLLAPLDSPAFTGTPTAPSPATADDSTKVATTEWVRNMLLDAVFPVGSIYYTENASFDPSVSFGGTWIAYAAGRVVAGLDATQSEFNTVGLTGGAKSVTLTASQLAPHRHLGGAAIPSSTDVYEETTLDMPGNATSNMDAAGAASVQAVTSSIVDSASGTAGTPRTSAAASHNNLQPYVVVMIWKRTA